MASFCKGVREDLQKSEDEVGDDDDGGADPEADSSPQERGLGYIALGVSSDEETSPQKTEGRPKISPKKTGGGTGKGLRNGRTRDWKAITFHGVPLVARKRAGAGIVVPADAESVKKLCDAIVAHQMFLTTSAAQSPVRCKKRAVVQHDHLDKGRVSPPSAGKRCFKVCYKDSHGKVTSTSKGLHLPMLNLANEKLNEDEYRRSYQLLEKKARALWNELDHSDRRRYSREDLEG
jgi:hypothetical protein